ncbi:MAG TPA: SpoIIE family protein phosphatase [Bacteroidia bacterium]|nr:SpoIIE family protein phosphatase [Bacteroidia bacterium]
MKKTRTYNLIFLCWIFLFPVITKATPDSLIYKIGKGKPGINVAFNGLNFSFMFTDNNKEKWVYYPGDNYKFALKNADDSHWKRLSTDFEINEIDSSTFKGIAWFRLHYKVSENFIGKTFMMRISHNGASEIFNDGHFLISFGNVSENPAEEVCRDPRNIFFPLTVNDTLEHVLAVRYSNTGYLKYYDKFDVSSIGFVLRFFHYPDMIEVISLSEYQRFFFIGISMFLFALALVHLMIYLFERSRKFNLYYSLFVVSLALLFLLPVLNKVIENPMTTFRLYYYGDALIPTFFMSVITLLYSLFQKKFNKYYWSCVICYAGALIMKYVFNNWSGFFHISLFFMMYISSTVGSIKAIRQKFRGAKIVGFGVLGVTIFLILSIASLLVFRENGFILAIMFSIFAILSLPLSMSVYLAYDFAGANKTLKEQIIQIEDLSVKAIKEEQEKKEILENQNQVLEEQVKERTAEIAEQNSVLENQKKEITDSIIYAKRIQQSILPAEEEFAKHLPKSFVLYMPKDIVSGDFYFLKKKGKEIFVAAADCTGHGVPGALMSMVAHEKLEDAVELNSEPGKILSLLNQGVKKTLKQSNTDNSTRDGCDIVLLRINGKEISYSGANRNLCIIRKGATTVEEIKSTKCAIGGLTSEGQVYLQHEAEMNDGDSVYLSSDGYADQFGGDKEKKLTTRKFKELLLSVQNLSMENQGKYLKDFNITWRNELEQIDDILVIGIRF